MWEEAEKQLSKDKFIAPLIQKWGSCTIKPEVHTDYFQALVGEIIGQQLSGKVADVIELRLKSKIVGRLSPDKILSFPEAELRNCGMAWSKVRAIKDLSEKIKTNKLHIKKLNILKELVLGLQTCF